MYSLLDEDDWSNWQDEGVQNQSLALVDPQLQLELAGAGAPASSMRPPPAEMAPLQLDSGPDWSDALGVGVAGIAGVADLALNKGRGFGQIMSSAGAYGNARSEQRVREQQSAMEYEAKRAQLAKQSAYNDYLYASLAERNQSHGATAAARTRSQDQRDVQLGVNQTAEQRKQGADVRAAENQDPSELIQWAGKRGYDLSGLKTMQQARAALGPLVKEWELEHAGQKAEAVAEGGIKAKLDNSEALGDAAASQAAKIEGATREGYGERAALGAQAREDVTGNIQNRADQQQQGRLNKFRDETEKTRPQIGLARSVEGVMGRYPQGDQPGVGIWDSFKSGKISDEDGLVVRNALTNMTDLVARVRSGAAIPPPEFEKIASFVAGGQGATEQQFRVAWNATVSALKSELKQQSAGRENEARSVLGGDADWALGKPAAPRGKPETMQPAPRGTARVSPGVQQGGAVRATPLGDGTFTVPGGSRPYSAADIQKLIAKGLVSP